MKFPFPARRSRLMIAAVLLFSMSFTFSACDEAKEILSFDNYLNYVPSEVVSVAVVNPEGLTDRDADGLIRQEVLSGLIRKTGNPKISYVLEYFKKPATTGIDLEKPFLYFRHNPGGLSYDCYLFALEDTADFYKMLGNYPEENRARFPEDNLAGYRSIRLNINGSELLGWKGNFGLLMVANDIDSRTGIIETMGNLMKNKKPRSMNRDEAFSRYVNSVQEFGLWVNVNVIPLPVNGFFSSGSRLTMDMIEKDKTLIIEGNALLAERVNQALTDVSNPTDMSDLIKHLPFNDPDFFVSFSVLADTFNTITIDDPTVGQLVGNLINTDFVKTTFDGRIVYAAEGKFKSNYAACIQTKNEGAVEAFFGTYPQTPTLAEDGTQYITTDNGTIYAAQVEDKLLIAPNLALINRMKAGNNKASFPQTSQTGFFMRMPRRMMTDENALGPLLEALMQQYYPTFKGAVKHITRADIYGKADVFTIEAPIRRGREDDIISELFFKAP